jgi:beta-glucosidase
VQDDSPLDALVGSAEDKALALEAIRESVTLLKNEKNRLPLDPKRRLNILVVGPTANSLTYQCGGWTIHWHGPLGDDEIPYGTTLFEGVKQLAAPGSTVDYLEGVDTEGKWVTDRQQLADRARQADVIVLGVGEEAYAEAAANIKDVALPRGQHDLATLLASASDAPIVTVLFEGRPRLLGALCCFLRVYIHVGRCARARVCVCTCACFLWWMT